MLAGCCISFYCNFSWEHHLDCNSHNEISLLSLLLYHWLEVCFSLESFRWYQVWIWVQTEEAISTLLPCLTVIHCVAAAFFESVEKFANFFGTLIFTTYACYIFLKIFIERTRDTYIKTSQAAYACARVHLPQHWHYLWITGWIYNLYVPTLCSKRFKKTQSSLYCRSTTDLRCFSLESFRWY